MQLRKKRRGAALTLIVLLGLIAMERCYQPRELEIALKIGEPWEDMRQRSSAKISPAIAGQYWGRQTKSDARLRFMDDQYGFVTPEARFFTITFERDGTVGNIRMSPQTEPLLLDDTLKIVLDLQEQWRNGGWRSMYPEEDPPLADTPQWRAQLRDIKKNGGVTYWAAGDQYRVLLAVGRFHDDRHPTQERYLITLELAKLWMDEPTAPD